MGTTDVRDANQLLKEWRKLQDVKRSLIKQGLLTDEATPAQVIDALRQTIPQDLFGKSE